jgi:hypothetical protein
MEKINYNFAESLSRCTSGSRRGPQETRELELKKSMLNVKFFSLMKKQLFSLVMLLALIVIAGTSVKAQDGLTFATPYSMVVGSVGSFNAADAGGTTAATSWTWTVWDISTAVQAYATNGGAASNATEYRYVTSLANLAAGPSNTATCFINWLSAPSQAGATMYAVQVITSNGTCTTTRRFFVSVFDFNVSIVLCDATGATEYIANQATCNTWSGLIIGNDVNGVSPFEGASITGPHADYLNVAAGVAKTTPTYFKVKMALSGNPPSIDLRNIHWRFQYTMPTATAMSIYTISTSSTAQFNATGGPSSVGGALPTDVYPVPASNWVYIPAQAAAGNSAEYIFMVSTHNLLSQDNMVYTARLDRVSLELTPANTDYNDGAKIWTSYGSGEPLIGAANEITVSETINMSPATDVINFNN